MLLLQPSPPLLFMGEEWGATELFPFFCDFKGELADAVRDGRKQEFAEAYAKHGGTDIPDPLAQATRDLAVLDWSRRRRQPRTASGFALDRARCSRSRRDHVVPLIPLDDRRRRRATSTIACSSPNWSAGGQRLLICRQSIRHAEATS